MNEQRHHKRSVTAMTAMAISFIALLAFLAFLVWTGRDNCCCCCKIPKSNTALQVSTLSAPSPVIPPPLSSQDDVASSEPLHRIGHESVVDDYSHSSVQVVSDNQTWSSSNHEPDKASTEYITRITHDIPTTTIWGGSVIVCDPANASTVVNATDDGCYPAHQSSVNRPIHVPEPGSLAMMLAGVGFISILLYFRQA